MTAEQKTAARGRIATVVATAAVTLAVGVTAAALGGYLVPARDSSSNTIVATQAMDRAVIETPAAPQTSAPNPSVVLVPVAPDGRSEPPATVPAPQKPELVFASYDTADHDDHHRGRGHDRHEHEDDDGDDD
jgi:hypothetical protein